MDDIRSKNSVYSYLIYGISALTFTLSVITLNAVLIAATAVLVLVSVIYMNSGHIVNSLLVRNLHIIEVSGSYKVSGNIYSAVKRENGAYKGVSIAVLKPNSKVESRSEIFEDLINKIRIPFEFSISLRKLDRKKVVDSFETKRRMKEIELSQVDPSDYKKVNLLKRQISTVENEIRIISEGSEPLEAMIKLKSFAQAESESEAARSSLKQLEQIANIVATAFKLDYTIVGGEDILDLL